MVYHQHINPMEKIVELYERLLDSEREKNQILTDRLNQSK